MQENPTRILLASPTGVFCNFSDYIQKIVLFTQNFGQFKYRLLSLDELLPVPAISFKPQEPKSFSVS